MLNHTIDEQVPMCTWTKDWPQAVTRLSWFPFWVLVFCTIVQFLHIYLQKRTTIFQTYSTTRKNYIVKNIFKSVLLLMLVPMSSIIFWNGVFKDKWERYIVTICGTLYAATDMVGVVMIRKLNMSTALHHACVMVFAIMTFTFDFYTCPWIQSLILYGCIASFTCTVNLYLGIRFILDKKKQSHWIFKDLTKFAKWSYVGGICLTWIIQYYYMFFIYSFDMFSTAYAFLSHVILYDDIVLIKHFFK